LAGEEVSPGSTDLQVAPGRLASLTTTVSARIISATAGGDTALAWNVISNKSCLLDVGGKLHRLYALMAL
jgi:hypothetical protein